MKSGKAKVSRLILRHRRVATGVTAVCVAAAALSVTLTALSPAAGATAGSAIPASAIARLTSAAEAVARQNGDADPASTAAVSTTHARALREATPGDTVPQGAGQTVYLIVMKGKFTANFPMPAGARKPTGTYLSITLNPATFQLMDLGLSYRAPSVSLSRFGPVSILHK
jgi:hypothetical protein